MTGSGKTFTAANVITQIQKPTLVLSPNKILAAQLYAEFKQFFPENAVEYFISYYDYYQPEAYVPSSDTYIEKDSSDQRPYRPPAAEGHQLAPGAPRRHHRRVGVLHLRLGLAGKLQVDVRRAGKGQDRFRARNSSKVSSRSIMSAMRWNFRAANSASKAIRWRSFPPIWKRRLRVQLWGDEIEKISEIHPVTGKIIREKDRTYIYPARHFVSTRPELEEAAHAIRAGNGRNKWLSSSPKGNFLEAQRLEQRTRFDLEMMLEMGFCHGIENYSRHLTGASQASARLVSSIISRRIFCCLVDESHVTIPQVNAMYEGDRSRKQVLVDYGFRLPSALDNRPLKFAEFEALVPQTLYISATPGPYELKKTKGVVVEQVIRPTGLMDPIVDIRPTEGQVDDLRREIEETAKKKERILVTTLTKRMAEDLADYFLRKNLRVRYLHSDIDTLKRIEILRDLRKGNFDALVGINLLREGLDLPEVSLVAVLDADKEGFLRSETTLIQVCGRAARNVNGRVILYADRRTGSMDRALQEMDRRRKKQLAYNEEHHITPQTIIKIGPGAGRVPSSGLWSACFAIVYR